MKVPNIFKKLPGYYSLVRKYLRFRDPNAFNHFFLFAPPGHFYSPVPDMAFIDQHTDRIFNNAQSEIPGIVLNSIEQCTLIESFKKNYGELPFSDNQTDNLRYYYLNDQFSYGDAVLLYSFIRHFRPRKIIEVGSGYSSALMLDVNDRYFNKSINFTFIEPFPERLFSLLKKGDREKSTIVIDIAQKIDPSLFASLKENDILFIDSSHVVKIGSDVVFLLTEILPKLNKGVIIHIHDIHWPFEYPEDWVRSGRAWNEAYCVKAFLQFNAAFKILLFNSYLGKHHRDRVKENLPLALKDIGSGLWLQKVV